MLSIKSPTDIAIMLAERTRYKRLHFAWSREELAKRSGVTASSLKRFERTGEISLKSFIKLCFTLHALEGFDQLLLMEEPKSLVDIERHLKIRKRGHRRAAE